MTGSQEVVNFDDMEKLHTVVSRLSAVPEKVLRKIHMLQIEELRARLNDGDKDRAEAIVNPKDFEGWRKSRCKPNSNRPIGWNPQMLTRIMAAVTYDDQEPVGMVLAQTSTSPSFTKNFPYPLSMIEPTAKLALPPYKHLHIREQVVDVERLEYADEVSDGFVPSGITIAGIWLLTQGYRHSADIRIYGVEDDFADSGIVDIARVLGARALDKRQPTEFPGYLDGSETTTFVMGIEQTSARILAMPGARYAINAVSDGAAERYRAA